VVIVYFAIAYELWPRLTGRPLVSKRLADIQLWLWFWGILITTVPWHIAGLMGQPRRYAIFDYSDPVVAKTAFLVILSVIGGCIVVISVLLFFYVLVRSSFAPVAESMPPIRYALSVNPPATVPALLNGFGLWNVIPAGARADCVWLSHRPVLLPPQSRCAGVFPDPGDHEMKLENGPRLHNPWGFIVVAVVSATVVIAFGLGFLLLPRYQEPRAPFSTKDAVYHALGFHIHGKAFNTMQPPPKVPTYIAWTESTIRQATIGDRKSGEFIATNCTACHGEKGLSTQPWIPSLAGLDRLVLYKQLDDFRSGTRLSGPMSAIAQSLTSQQYADVSAYFASLPGLPETAASGRRARTAVIATADPVAKAHLCRRPETRHRGNALLATAPAAYRIGAPALAKQNELYLEQQLQAFALGTRATTMDMPMRRSPVRLPNRRSERSRGHTQTRTPTGRKEESSEKRGFTIEEGRDIPMGKLIGCFARSFLVALFCVDEVRQHSGRR